MHTMISYWPVAVRLCRSLWPRNYFILAAYFRGILGNPGDGERQKILSFDDTLTMFVTKTMKSRKHFIVMFVCQKLKCPQQARTVFSDGQLAGLERRWDHNQTTNCNPNYKMTNRLKPDWWGIHFTGFRPSVIFQLQSGSNLPEPWLWVRLRSRLGSKTGESLN